LTFDNGAISSELLVDKITPPTGLAISALQTDRVGNIYVLSVFDGKIFKMDTAYIVNQVLQHAATQTRLSESIIDGSRHSSTLYFDLPEAQHITLSLFDAEGRELHQYFSREFDAGENSYEFDTRSLKSGMYFLKMQAEKGIVMKKIIVLS